MDVLWVGHISFCLFWFWNLYVSHLVGTELDLDCNCVKFQSAWKLADKPSLLFVCLFFSLRIYFIFSLSVSVMLKQFHFDMFSNVCNVCICSYDCMNMLIHVLFSPQQSIKVFYIHGKVMFWFVVNCPILRN